MGKLSRLSAVTGLSVSTISRVLNRSANVSAEKREAVLAAAKALGIMGGVKAYHNLIVVVSDGRNDPFHHEVIEGINSLCSEFGYSLVEFKLNANNFIREKIEPIASAIIFIGERSCNGSVKELGVPYIFIGDSIMDATVPSIKIDNLQAAHTATKYLCERGHRRIGQILGDKSLKLVELRNMGYKSALRQAGITVDMSWNYYGDFSFRAGEKAMDYFMRLPERPTAIFSHCDRMAIGAMKRANEMGLSVPDDISLIGFQNIEIAEYMALTTVSQNLRQIGRSACMAIHEKITKNKDIASVLYFPDVVERGTVRRI